MKKLYFKIESLWFTIPQTLRFLIIGGINTVISFLIFSLLICCHLIYEIALLITYIITINLSIFTMRYYVFRSHGNLIKAYTKAWLSYLSCILLNYATLYILIDLLQINTILAQGIFTIISTIYLYIIHQKFSFH